ncbi:peptidyl-prolyl cis-trans isomerase CYP21-3, mitochondrial isoform X2 [Gossypium raimondii]|uniref:peptidyl-prolyl cis-trans isomerase CYP21-3, mitochondrial isoform X2 n=1 Tax=Gossypium raimondii TaxID=29730 RepID=UPI00227B0D68|nr:peptidyl-prolyl cis-trans isomerase CYP21-3, mitochondrial isoform X2 [Gossypium raimondii]
MLSLFSFFISTGLTLNYSFKVMARIKPQALLQQSKRKKGTARISLTTITMLILIVVLILFFVYATYRHWTQRSRIHIENRESVIEILDTAKGSITVELFKDSSLEVVDQFLDLWWSDVAWSMQHQWPRHS